MGKITFSNGVTMNFEGTPTPADIEEMSSVALKQTPINKSDNLQSFSNADKSISNRPSAIADLTKNPTTWQHPLGAALRTMQGAGELYQGVPASIALDLQRGRPQDIMGNLGKVVTGQRPAQYGDVFQGAGVPKPLAAAGGVYADTVLAPGGAELGAGLAKAAGSGIKNIAQGGIQGVLNLVKNIKNVQNPTEFAQGVRASLFAQKQQVGKNFGAAIDQLSASNPNVSVDLSDAMNSLKSAIGDAENNPGLAGQVKGIIRGIKDPTKAKLINDIIEDPSKAASLTLQQSNDIKTAIQNAPAISTKLKQGKFAQFTPGDLEVLDLIDQVKLAQSENFPQLANIRKPYAEYMQNYQQVKNLFKPASLENKIKNGFGTGEIEQMVKHVLPGASSQQIKAFRRTLFGLKAAGVAGGLGATAIGVPMAVGAVKKMLGNGN